MQRLPLSIVLPLVAIIAGTVAFFHCRGADDGSGWWCRDVTQATRHADGEQACWREQSSCVGMCSPRPTAYCYALAAGEHCLATAAQCDRKQASDPLASSRCMAKQ